MSDRVTALDGLRAFAVVAVLANHSRILLGGFIGVQVFFVLSGYLITSILVREHQRSGSIDLRRFYARRGRRLFPALVAMVVATVVVQERSLTTLGDAAGALTYSMDFIAATGLPLSNLGHTWSLAIEEQFYLVWPLVLLLLLPRLGYRLGALVAAAGALADAVLRGIAWDSHGHTAETARWLYTSPQWRLDALLPGCALALWLAAYPSWRPSPRLSALLVGGSLAAIGWELFAPGPFSGWTASPSAAAVNWAAAGLIAVLVRGNAPGLALLSSGPMVLLGRLSYGIYLWHPLVMELAPLPDGAALFISTTVLSTAAAAVSYQLIERRFLPVESRFALVWRTASPQRVRAAG